MKSTNPSQLEFAADSRAAHRFFSERLGFLMAQSGLKQKMDNGDEDFIVLDVRHADVFSESRIPGAVHVDADSLETEWHKFDPERINVIYCYSELCHRAARVCLEAALKEIPVMELHGGFEGWEHYPMPLETGTPQ